MLGRTLLSCAVLLAAGMARAVWFPVSAIGSGMLAGGQLANSDAAAVVAVTGMSLFSGATALLTLGTFALLLLIWFAPLKRAVSHAMKEGF